MRVKIGVDHIFNGQGYGDVAEQLVDADMNPAMLRPWRSIKNGRSYITLNGRDGRPRNYVTNAPSTMTKYQWQYMDSILVRVARPTLHVWGDIVGEGLTYTVPDGMGTIVLQEQTITDGGKVRLDMDALVESERDRPTFDIRNFPLPIIHGDVSFSARQLAVSRRAGVGGVSAPFDTTMLEQVTRRMMEKVEVMCIGDPSLFSYGGGAIYGFTTKPERLTTVMTNPTDPSWTPQVFVDEINGMISALQDRQFYGPYGLYFSPSWAQYMNGDYVSTYPETLGARVDMIDDIKFRRKVRFGLSGYQVVIWQLTPNVVRAVTGMRLQTIQWDSRGGLAKHFKIMAIMVPQLRSNADNQTGINHGTAV